LFARIAALGDTGVSEIGGQMTRMLPEDEGENKE